MIYKNCAEVAAIRLILATSNGEWTATLWDATNSMFIFKYNDVNDLDAVIDSANTWGGKLWSIDFLSREISFITRCDF